MDARGEAVPRVSLPLLTLLFCSLLLVRAELGMDQRKIKWGRVRN